MHYKNIFISTFIYIFLALPYSILHAEDTNHIKDITKGDPYFYTSDQAITDHDGQKLLVGQGRPSTTHSKVPHLPFFSGLHEYQLHIPIR